MSSMLQLDGCYHYTVVAPSRERLRGNAGMVCLQCKKNCDPCLSASGASFSQWGAIQIYLSLSSYLLQLHFMSVPCPLRTETFQSRDERKRPKRPTVVAKQLDTRQVTAGRANTSCVTVDIARTISSCGERECRCTYELARAAGGFDVVVAVVVLGAN